MSNIVFTAMSLDGYIADRNGGLEWLNAVPNPDNDDFGYNVLIERIDAIVMGRTTFETVIGFGIKWPYDKPVFVLSNTLQHIPVELRDRVHLINGLLETVIRNLKQQGYEHLYIDGGKTIQNFLREGLIDELIITIIPVLLGGGARLFGELPGHVKVGLKSSRVFYNNILQNHYIINK